MASSVFFSLRFRIATAVLVLAVMMLGAALNTLSVIRTQRTHEVLLHTAGQLQLTAQTLDMQGMNYFENAPRDYPTYFRDVKLYFQDLMGHVETFDMFTDAFMHQDFGPDVTGLDSPLYPRLDPDTMKAVNRVETIWAEYRKGLMESLGEDPDEPRLEWAAKYVVENSQDLKMATDALEKVIRREAAQVWERVNTVNLLLLALYGVISVGTLVWFFRRVIRPLSTTAVAFRRVALGDFGYQVPVSSRDEIASLRRSFNHLSRHVHALVQLTTRIQQGSDLGETLRVLADTFPDLFPLDWIGIFFVTPSGQLRLEGAYSRGAPVVTPIRLFATTEGILSRALSGDNPYRPDTRDSDAREDGFLEWLQQQDVQDALFLPVPDQMTNSALLVIGSNTPDSYTPDHLELIGNIALLVSLSLGRTVQLAERTRLAAIGEFTSGIVHEMRTPLATISMALEYLTTAGLPEGARTRARLAGTEALRLTRLLTDLLDYARPVTLDLESVDAAKLLAETLERHPDLAGAGGPAVELSVPEHAVPVTADPNRMTQVIINLTRNAAEAAGPSGFVHWDLYSDPEGVHLQIKNSGEPIAPLAQERLFEPFYTTKAGGTGLGLSIVKRLVEAHGGEIRVTSSEKEGTSFHVLIPSAEKIPVAAAARG